MEKVKFLELKLPVRYEDEDMPYDMPFRHNNTFSIIYDIETGEIHNFNKMNIDISKIIEWNRKTERVSANLLEDYYIFSLKNMKVTDGGSYYLLDKNLYIVHSLIQEYVPDSHSVDGKYGDYINIEIDFKNGKILNLKENATFKEFLEK